MNFRKIKRIVKALYRFAIKGIPAGFNYYKVRYKYLREYPDDNPLDDTSDENYEFWDALDSYDFEKMKLLKAVKGDINTTVTDALHTMYDYVIPKYVPAKTEDECTSVMDYYMPLEIQEAIRFSTEKVLESKFDCTNGMAWNMLCYAPNTNIDTVRKNAKNPLLKYNYDIASKFMETFKFNLNDYDNEVKRLEQFISNHAYLMPDTETVTTEYGYIDSTRIQDYAVGDHFDDPVYTKEHGGGTIINIPEYKHKYEYQYEAKTNLFYNIPITYKLDNPYTKKINYRIDMHKVIADIFIDAYKNSNGFKYPDERTFERKFGQIDDIEYYIIKHEPENPIITINGSDYTDTKFIYVKFVK
jgi:hypothetical protein